MKKTTIGVLMAIMSFGAYKSDAQQKKKTMTTASQLTSQERAYAIKFLNETESGVTGAIKNLSEGQLTYKPDTVTWSVDECIKHIAAAETTLWAMVETALKQTANPEKREGIKFTDEQLVKAVEDRSQKSKTFAALEPANSLYKTTAEALASFKENRTKLIAFVKNTKQDLRNHVSVLPIGTYDAYQFILLISAHTNRHTQQLEAVKTSTGFPKN